MIKKILLILVLNLVFIFSNNLIFAEQNTDCEQLNGLDEYINETMADWNVPGMAIAIVKDGKAIYMKGFGYRDLDKKLEVTAETIFAIGSDSKAFTSAALGILVDEGKLDLDKPIKNYMPEFKLKKDYATDHVTPRDLLLHITGISRNDAILTNTPYNREELVSKLQYLKPFAEMRTKWRYNNFMYVTLGYLIEKITGKTWEEFVQEKILNPLDMKSTNFSVTESQKSDNYSLPYEVTEKGSKVINFANADSIGPAGSINSNVVDMSKWLILNLNEGKYNDKQIVSEEMMEEIHTPQFFISDKIKFEGLYYDSYALAWGANNYKGHRLLRHDGEIAGFHASIHLLPDDNIGVVSLSNGKTLMPHVINWNVIERLLGLEQQNWSEKFKKQNKETEEAVIKQNKDFMTSKKSDTKPTHKLNDYAGSYFNKAYGNLIIDYHDNQLKFTYNDMVYPLEHFNYDTFILRDDGNITPVSFYLNESGDIVKLKIPFDPDAGKIKFKKNTDKK